MIFLLIFFGQMDTFEFEAVDLGDLDSVIVSHDGRGHGAGIFLDKIVVKERDSENSDLQYVFPCGRWLDSHQDDCLTQRTLRMLGKQLVETVIYNTNLLSLFKHTCSYLKSYNNYIFNYICTSIRIGMEALKLI